VFTGIVTHRGTVVRTGEEGGGIAFEIESDLPLDAIALGASVAHSGVCLTVTGKAAGRHTVFASKETLARTTLAAWRTGTRVNLERSLALGDELGGHLVFGHVDGVGEVRAIERCGEAYELVTSLPSDLVSLVAVKGSIAVDGVSLTVNMVDATSFTVMLVPHTWKVTTLGERQVGDGVNLEADMLARYVARRMALMSQGPRAAADERDGGR